MGNYYFTSCADGSKTKVEYTFGYKKNADGKEGISETLSCLGSRAFPKILILLLELLGDIMSAIRNSEIATNPFSAKSIPLTLGDQMSVHMGSGFRFRV